MVGRRRGAHHRQFSVSPQNFPGDTDSDSRVLVLQGYGSEVRIEAAPVPPVGEAEAAEDACKQRNHDSGQVYLNF